MGRKPSTDSGTDSAGRKATSAMPSHPVEAGGVSPATTAAVRERIWGALILEVIERGWVSYYFAYASQLPAPLLDVLLDNSEFHLARRRTYRIPFMGHRGARVSPICKAEFGSGKDRMRSRTNFIRHFVSELPMPQGLSDTQSLQFISQKVREWFPEVCYRNLQFNGVEKQPLTLQPGTNEFDDFPLSPLEKQYQTSDESLEMFDFFYEGPARPEAVHLGNIVKPQAGDRYGKARQRLAEAIRDEYRLKGNCRNTEMYYECEEQQCHVLLPFPLQFRRHKRWWNRHNRHPGYR